MTEGDACYSCQHTIELIRWIMGSPPCFGLFFYIFSQASDEVVFGNPCSVGGSLPWYTSHGNAERCLQQQRPAQPVPFPGGWGSCPWKSTASTGTQVPDAGARSGQQSEIMWQQITSASSKSKSAEHYLQKDLPLDERVQAISPESQ